MARDTIEEKILLLLERKRSLADAIVGEENSILRQITGFGAVAIVGKRCGNPQIFPRN